MQVSQTLKRAAHAVGAHKVTTHPATQRVVVRLGDEVLADSRRAVALEETGLPTRYYLPREDVRTELLVPSATTSHCPFKGDATYFSAGDAKDAFWVYEAPSTRTSTRPGHGARRPAIGSASCSDGAS